MTALLTAIKVALWLLLGSLAAQVMPQASPASRHRIIALTLGTSLVVPLLSLVVPAWEVLPATQLQSVWTVKAPADGTPRDRRSTSTLTDRSLPPAPNLVGAQAAEPIPAQLVVKPGWRRVLDRAPEPRILSLLWATGAACFLLVLAIRVLAIGATIHGATPILDPQSSALLEELTTSLGIGARVELRRHAAGAMPFVWGLFRPQILLPAESAGWTEDRRRAVIAHELAHVARRDIATLLLAQVACALHWFNPLAWRLARRLKVERELTCDSLVVRQGVEATQYADLLLNLASTYGRTHSLAPVMAARSQLEGRIMNILDSTHRSGTSSRATRIATAAIACIALIPLSSLAWVGPASGPEVGITADLEQPRHADSDTERFRDELYRLGISRSDGANLIAGLRADSPLTRAACAWGLGSLGETSAVEPLVSILGHDSPLVREWAVRALGQIGEWRSGEPMLVLLDDQSAKVRQWTARTLSQIVYAPAAPSLINALDDEDAEVREWVVRALGELRDEQAVQPLIDRIDDPSPQVRQWIVRSLGELRDERATPVLVDAMNDADAEVREWAARSLSDIGRPSEPKEVWDRRVGYVEPLMPGIDDGPPTPGDPAAIAALIEALSSADPIAREWSVRSLGEIGDSSATGPLIALLDDQSLATREWAARSLGSLRDPAAVDPLIGAMGDGDATVREWAVRSLGVLRDERAFSPLVAALDDESPEVRQWAARGLGASADSRAIEALNRSLEDPDADVRRWTLRALEHIEGVSPRR